MQKVLSSIFILLLLVFGFTSFAISIVEPLKIELPRI